MTASVNAAGQPVSAPATLSAPSKYMPGLDVLRGLAITLVLVYHGVGYIIDYPARLTPTQFHLLFLSKFGRMGVHLFFVLSGFLISGILLDTRHNKSFYKPFYMRRILRIVPVYVFIIAVLKLSGTVSWRYTAACLLYICNMTSLIHVAPEYGPFWTLSVEEQFYLIWPFIVRNLRLRNLFRLSVIIVVGTPLLRLALGYAPPPFNDIYYKTWAVGDFFASGAILAMLVRSQSFRLALRPIAAACCAVGLVLVCIANQELGDRPGTWRHIQRAAHLEPWLILFSGMVLGAYLYPQIASSRLAAPFVFLSKISYGLYLFHPFIYDRLLKNWARNAGSSAGSAFLGWMVLRLFVATAISIAVAYLSRITLEEFFLRRKPRQPKVVEDLSPAL
jgi:peptidoglycan/LPS O-acetylase OafA/YrhL